MQKAIRAMLAIALAAVLGISLAQAQDSGTQQGGRQGRGQGRGFGGGGMMGRGITGTVTEATADHFTVKTETGQSYTIHYSANTRFMKTVPPAGGAPSQSQTQGQGQGRRGGFGGQPPVAIQSSEIKVGDVLVANGEIDDNAKSVGAVSIVQLDPARAKQMQEMQANFGKTWLMGKVTAINEAKVTIQSQVDNAAHTFTADENTTFRKRRDPITLLDVKVGDELRIDGAVANGAFVAKSVMVMGAPGMGTGPGGGQAPQQ